MKPENANLITAAKRIILGSLVMTEFRLRTQARVELINITPELANIAKASGIRQGALLVLVPHTTAGITINENADPDVCADLIDELERLVPRRGTFRHGEGNADAHVKASLMGSSVLVPVKQGKLVLGTWQGVFFCEFDGPRHRTVVAELLGGN
jgi:secondary thiamine-phosphate synthase enzyme